MAKRIVFVMCFVAAAVLVFSGCATTGETKVPKTALRVNCAAAGPYTDNAGDVWLADQQFEKGKEWGAVDGMTVDRGDLGISGTNSPKVYQTERYSMSAYKFIVPNGRYTVRLHFAETFSGITGEGQRVFSVTINGNVVLKDLDVYKEAGGSNKPVVKEFKGVAVTGKELVIGFVSNIQNPEVNGIEILAE
jgi:hypothetical protein